MRNYFRLLFFILFISSGCGGNQADETAATDMQPPVVAPFEKLDTLAVNDWWNRADNPIIDMKVDRSEVVAFGMYTVSNNTLKLTAQLYPLYPDETREVRLEVQKDGAWQEVQIQTVNDLGWSALFRVENWDSPQDTTSRLLPGEGASLEGLIRKDPID